GAMLRTHGVRRRGCSRDLAGRRSPAAKLTPATMADRRRAWGGDRLLVVSCLQRSTCASLAALGTPLALSVVPKRVLPIDAPDRFFVRSQVTRQQTDPAHSPTPPANHRLAASSRLPARQRFATT